MYADEQQMVNIVEKSLNEIMQEVRQAIADYMKTEGCSCCRDYEGHEINKARLGELLRVKKYADGSGYDFREYCSK